MTQFLGHIRGKRVDMLKKLLWKIQDELVSMNYEDRESLEMRWFEGDILAVQEKMTAKCDVDGDGVEGEMRTIGWVEFQQNYWTKQSGSDSATQTSSELRKHFEPNEVEIQRIIYRRFKHLYSTRWQGQDNPQDLETLQMNRASKETLERALQGEELIDKELRTDSNIGLVVPDH